MFAQGGDECPGGGFSLDIYPGACVVMQVRFLGSGFSDGGHMPACTSR